MPRYMGAASAVVSTTGFAIQRNQRCELAFDRTANTANAFKRPVHSSRSTTTYKPANALQRGFRLLPHDGLLGSGCTLSGEHGGAAERFEGSPRGTRSGGKGSSPCTSQKAQASIVAP